MGSEWRLLRAKLNLAAAHAIAAAEASTIEVVARQMGEASMLLIDADFIRRQIVSGRAPHQHEKWMLQESAKGGMYCAACGEDVVTDHPNGSTDA
jgi:hypothetical protein